jgi:hypothetical protein
MKLKKPKLILLGAVLVVALGYPAVRWAAKDYERFLNQQARNQVPVGIRDPVLWEMKARMFWAGYEAGRAADLENKPTKEQIFENAGLASKELDVRPEHVEVCLDRFKEGFYAGQFDAESVKLKEHETQSAGQ